MDCPTADGGLRLGGCAGLHRSGPRLCLWRRLVRRLHAMGIRDRPTAPRSPWQNAYAERLIGSIRREILDHVVVLGKRHLRHILRSYMTYYKHTSQHPSVYVIEENRLC